MTVSGVRLECGSCGVSWEVTPKPDGSMPGSSRCPRDRGGCGKLRRVPRSPGPAMAPASGAGWDPPSEPRGDREAGSTCPECGGGLLVDPRGITRWCPSCPLLVTPPGVTEPYRRGTETARAARSQRERDDDAKRVVLAAGEFLRRVGALLADPRIHPASADLLRWYEEEITDARRDRDGRRLAELAGEFADDATARAFRRLRWWQGEPAALAPGTDEDDYDEGQGAVLEFAGEAAAAVAAVPAAGPAQGEPMTWAAAVAACGWQLAVAGSAGVQWCQVVDEHGQQCRTGATSPGIADGRGGHAWLCGRHYGALGRLITDANRLRGIT